MAFVVRASSHLAASAAKQQCSSVCRSQGFTLQLAASSSSPCLQPFASSSAPPLRAPHRQASSHCGKSVRCMASTMSPPKPQSFYDFTVKDIDGQDINLGDYKGSVVLVVNVASQCGFTPQYKELAQLYNRYKDDGLVILGFPCNQFGQQEPGDNDKVKKFAQERGAKFPMMSKVDVNGPRADPVYHFLKEKQGGVLFADIKWNFTKFLLDRQGNVVKRYGSVTTPLSIEDDIKSFL